MKKEHKPEVSAGVVENRTDVTNKELEQLLQSSELKMIEFLNCGVFAYTIPERRVLAINDEARRLFQYNSTDNLSFYDNMMDHILQEDYSTVHAISYNLKKIGDCHRYKFRSRQNDGTILTLDCYSKLLAFEDKRLFILNVMHDVTEQEYTANLLRRERKQYREAVMLNSEYFYELDVTDGIMYSDFTYLKSGITMGTFLGISFPIKYDELLSLWKEKVCPEFLTPEECNLLNSEELLRRCAQGITHLSAEYYSPLDDRFFRTDTLLSVDEVNGHTLAAVFSTDITENIREEARKRNELAKANRILQKQMGITKAFSSFYISSFEIDLLTGEITEIFIPEGVRSVFTDSLGNYSKTIDTMVHSFVKEEFQASVKDFLCLDTIAERLGDQRIISCEYMGTNSGWCLANLIPLKYDENGKLTNVVFAIRGNEAEKQKELEAKRALQEAYEAANRANIAKTNFLASMSHDIRTPLNSIIGMTAIAGTHLEDRERVEDCLSKIAVSGKHLMGLINEVLDMNKIESDKLNLMAENFNISELVDNLLTMTKSLMEEKKQEFSVSVKGVEHENVIGDSRRVQQVFMNLMGNAVKYTPEGGKINLTIREMPTNTPKVGYYEFIFEDNGIGMSKEFLPTIFEPFSRANDSRTAGVQGTGLGMPITKNIVHMMNGDIKVESELNKGTKVTVTIMLELQEVEESDKEFTDLSVLVADDDRIACESTCEVLRQLGMQGEWVLTEKEAVEQISARHEEKKDYFAVILNRKPSEDGIETIKEIRRKVDKEVPAIIISAYDWSEMEYEARAAGANAFISKPLFKSRVAQMFRALVGEESEKNASNALIDLQRENFAGHRALLVEDNELNREVAEKILEMTGLEVELAEDGKQAFDIMTRVESGYYDIIFMDIQMPFMNGYEATRAIRTLPGEYTKQVPIIAMTANAFVEDVQAAKNAGMNEHIAKPLDFDQLLKSLNHWLG